MKSSRSDEWDKKEREGRVFKKLEKGHTCDFVLKKDDFRCRTCNRTREQVRRDW